MQGGTSPWSLTHSFSERNTRKFKLFGKLNFTMSLSSLLFILQLWVCCPASLAQDNEVNWISDYQIESPSGRHLSELGEDFALDDSLLSSTKVSLDDATTMASPLDQDQCHVYSGSRGTMTICEDQVQSALLQDEITKEQIAKQRLDDRKVISYSLARARFSEPGMEMSCAHQDELDDMEGAEDQYGSTLDLVEQGDDEQVQALRGNQARELQGLPQTRDKFLDVLVVVDFPTYRQYGGTVAAVTRKVISIVSQTKQIFLAFHPVPHGIVLRLAGIHMLTSRAADPFRVQEEDMLQLIADFNIWRLKRLSKLPSHAVAHLLTARPVTKKVVARLLNSASVCNMQYASSASVSTSQSELYLAKLMAHGLGHTLGMRHTNQFGPSYGVNMDMARKCVNFEHDVMRDQFPDDSLEYSWGPCASIWFRTFLRGFPNFCEGSACRRRPLYGNPSYPRCLERDPTRRVQNKLEGFCGDGVVDPTEECDCFPSYSDATCRRDFCCARRTCTSVPNCIPKVTTAPSKTPTRSEYTGDGVCFNLCTGRTNNGFCEDGGPGSVATFCFLGGGKSTLQQLVG